MVQRCPGTLFHLRARSTDSACAGPPTDPAVYAPFSPRASALRGPHSLSTSEVDVEQVVAASEQWLMGKGNR